MAGLVGLPPPPRPEAQGGWAGVRGLVGGAGGPTAPISFEGRVGGLAAPKNPEGGGTGWLVGPVDPTSLKGEAWVWGQWSCFPSESSKGGTGPGGGGGAVSGPTALSRKGMPNLVEGLMVP